MFSKLIFFINHYGYKAIFILITIENLFPPIPCELILTFSGFLTTYTNLKALGIIIVSSLGSFIGALILYGLGFLIKQESLFKLLLKLHFNLDQINKSFSYFNTYGNIIIFIARLIPIIRSIISIPAGIIKMNFFTFSLYTLLGSLIWNSILVYLGVLLGNNWQMITKYLNWYLIIVIIIIVLVYLKRKLQ